MAGMKRRRRLASALVAAWLLGLPLASGVAPMAWGQAAEGEQRQHKTRRVPSMSEATFKKLAEAQMRASNCQS